VITPICSGVNVTYTGQTDGTDDGVNPLYIWSLANNTSGAFIVEATQTPLLQLTPEQGIFMISVALPAGTKVLVM